MTFVTFFLPQQAQCAGKVHYIYARVTFHNAGPNRKTCLGRRQRARMLAVNTCNLKSNPLPFNAQAQIIAYLDRSGCSHEQKLPTGVVADKFGRRAMRQANRRMSLPSRGGFIRQPCYRIDYYFVGKMTSAMQNCNTKICKVAVYY